jgi:hypothetical protein
MGMRIAYRRIPAFQLGDILDDPSLAGELVFAEDDELLDGTDPPVIDLDKMWHGIHYLLVEGEEDPVAGQVVLGGQEIGDDVGFGPVRYLVPGEVEAVAAHLDGTPFDVLVERFDPDRMNGLGVYPEIWDEDGVLDDELAPAYERLVGFYRTAAERGEVVLVALA